MVSTKTFQIWCHSVSNWGSYRQKTAVWQLLDTWYLMMSGLVGSCLSIAPLVAVAIFTKIFAGPWCKNYGSDLNNYVAQKWDGRPLCACKVQWRLVDARWQMKNNTVVSLYVCHAGCPGKRSGRSTTYSVTICRAISMQFLLFFTERNGLSNRLQRFQLDGATMFDWIGKIFEKFIKKLTEKFVSTTSTI